MQQPHPSASSPSPGAGESSSSSSRYVPTAEERSIINHANRTFLLPYVTGIALGVATGFAVSLRVSSNWKGMTIFGCSVAGEFGGRKMGEWRARGVLAERLPANSKLREVLGNRLPGFGPSRMTLEGTERVEHDYSLEGSVPPDIHGDSSTSRSPFLRRPPPYPSSPSFSSSSSSSYPSSSSTSSSSSSSFPSPSDPSMQSPAAENVDSQTESSSSSWDRLRARNRQEDGSAWSRLRQQAAAGAGSPGSAGGTGTAAYSDAVYDSGDDDLDGFENRGVARGGGGGGGASRAPDASAKFATARTREELEALERAGAIRKNRYGDPVD
ncbi:hypothetical protein DFJ73DRAFT_372808 [Zopfochytrium polystomum]|nr:hypothetical protein DFJ73DRAFT_372808 [Zopfochytrium polystomum]